MVDSLIIQKNGRELLLKLLNTNFKESRKEKTGIYQIKNLVNNKKYIGKSINIEGRVKTHFNSLKNQNHHNKKLQEDFLEYGEDSFEVSVLEECEPKELSRKEQEHCCDNNVWDPDKGYNINKINKINNNNIKINDEVIKNDKLLRDLILGKNDKGNLFIQLDVDIIDLLEELNEKAAGKSRKKGIKSEIVNEVLRDYFEKKGYL